jgi:hypothetical protein
VIVLVLDSSATEQPVEYEYENRFAEYEYESLYSGRCPFTPTPRTISRARPAAPK